mgnify:CR=1 FL=1
MSRCTWLLLAALTCGVTTDAQAEDTTRSVKVSGTAVAKVMPDTVVWHIRLTHTDPNLKVAREASDAATREILAMREALNIAAKDLQTGSLSINKVFHRDRSGNQQAFRHYSFQRTIVMRQRDTKDFDDILQRLTGIENVSISHSLESSDFHKLRRETRLRALEIARDKSNEMTEFLVSNQVPVLNIDETSPAQPSWYSSHVSNAAFHVGEPATPDDIIDSLLSMFVTNGVKN